MSAVVLSELGNNKILYANDTFWEMCGGKEKMSKYTLDVHTGKDFPREVCPKLLSGKPVENERAFVAGLYHVHASSSLVGDSAMLTKFEDKSASYWRIGIDELTGFPNGDAIIGRLALSQDKIVTLLVVDLDDFGEAVSRMVNRNGDSVITGIANKLKRHVDGFMTRAAPSSDKFHILLSGSVSRDEVVRIHSLCSHGNITSSMGACTGPPSVHTFRRSQLALFEAKDAGKNRVHFSQ